VEELVSRVQLALNVDDIDAATTFYSTLFGVEPAKTRPGYANFAIASPPLKLVLIEKPGQGGSLNHLGVEVESTAEVELHQARLTEAGFFADEEKNTTCCYAVQDKFWVTGPNGEKWEHYAVLADSPTFYGEATDGDACCRSDTGVSDTPAGEAATTTAACC
jgi:catechol 2,3-dioxygenase-like lactoylglutathione lyase family enzyme